tara:strand:- start:2805 stop:3074 length:270 start_codon:yes stop_codon:yes gene_type:complete
MSDWHHYSLGLYEAQQAWEDQQPEPEPEVPNILCEARKPNLLQRLFGLPGELLWEEWVESDDHYHFLVQEGRDTGLTLSFQSFDWKEFD